MKWMIYYVWAFLWAALLTTLLLLPSEDLPSNGWFQGFDKMVHTGSFYLLTALILYGRVQQTKRRARKIPTLLVVMFIIMIFAGLTEIAQMYLTNSRQADWWDVFADAVGMGMALFSFLLFYHKRSRDKWTKSEHTSLQS